MTEIQDVFEINSPLKKTWALLSDLVAIQAYLPGIKRVTFKDQKRNGLGVLRISEYQSGTILNESVAAWKDESSIRFDIKFVRGNPPPVDSLSHEWHLAAKDDLTILTSIVRYTPKYDVIGRLIDSFYLRLNIERAYRNTCLAFQYFLENGKPATANDLRAMREANNI